MTGATPFDQYLKNSGTMILDGGLATELEFRGFNLVDKLWSARLLIDTPAAIRQVHYDYLVAGADCIISSSYQGTIDGFMERGFSHEQAVELLELSVELAVEARDVFWADHGRRAGRLKPLVAASIGPYGAYLADGSEFTGEYDLDRDGLLEFHEERRNILSGSGADILACETIPSMAEAEVLVDLFNATSHRVGWVSFSCKDRKHINDGTPIRLAAERLDQVDNVHAVGINCTAPEFIAGLIKEVRSGTNKPVIVYPNSGEIYDPVDKRWTGKSDVNHYAETCLLWQQGGATLIGGCCRTRPEHIRSVRKRLVG